MVTSYLKGFQGLLRHSLLQHSPKSPTVNLNAFNSHRIFFLPISSELQSTIPKRALSQSKKGLFSPTLFWEMRSIERQLRCNRLFLKSWQKGKSPSAAKPFKPQIP